MDFVESCRQVISIDSSPSQGNFSLAQYFEKTARDLGLFVESQIETHKNMPQINLIIRPMAERPDMEFMMQTHLDTPDPGPFGYWTKNDHNPFNAHIIEGHVFGLGAANCKLDFLCKLYAVAELTKAAKWKLPPVLVGTFGEESGMAGALKLIRKNKVTVQMALIGEPSNLRLMTAGNGLAMVEIRIPFEDDERTYRAEHNLRESTSTQSRFFNGKTAHSSAPQLGESAIKKLFEYLGQIPSDLTIMEIDGGASYNTVPANAFVEIDLFSGHRFPMARKLERLKEAISQLEKDFYQFEDSEFEPNHPTLNIGVIKTFEDHVLVLGSCRLTPSIQTDVYEGWMNELKKSCTGVGAELRIADYKRPYRVNPDSPFVKGCQAILHSMQLDSRPSLQSPTNEASLFSRIGVECICFGAGIREKNIYTPTENVSIDDLGKSIEFYKQAIERFCL